VCVLYVRSNTRLFRFVAARHPLLLSLELWWVIYAPPPLAVVSFYYDESYESATPSPVLRITIMYDLCWTMIPWLLWV
jgi:hypothetical protein